MNPGMTPENQLARGRILSRIRSFFENTGYLEVEPPTLSPHIIPESAIEVFATQLKHPYRTSQDLFLLPSPEYWMKILLSQGWGNIFSMGHSYRNAESSGRWHNPEFTMLEYYTVKADYLDSMELTQRLLTDLGTQDFFEPRGPLTPKKPSQASGSLRLGEEPLVLSMQELFQKECGISLADNSSLEEFAHVARGRGFNYPTASTWEELFNFIMVDHIEPGLPSHRPVFLMDYPWQIPTLAKRTKDGFFSQRWELYLGSLELANCFTEEDDPHKVQKFFEMEEQSKKNALVSAKPDWEYSRFFDRFPPSSGVALGVDRLVASILGEDSLQGVILFPFYDSLLDDKN